MTISSNSAFTINNINSRILVTGITSIHGWPIWQKLVAEMPETNIFGICPPQTKCHIPGNTTAVCITDKEHLLKIRDTFKPGIIIHCAGVCDLDICEERPQWAYSLNVTGTETIYEVFGQTSKIFYMSTDLVFSGDNPPTDGYCEKFTPDPVSVAGKTFSQAEAILKDSATSCTIRLGLPLGDSITGDKGAIDWVKSRLTKNRPVTLFYDELRSCVWCDQIAEMTVAALNLDLSGIFHFGGKRSWQLYEIGQYVLEKYNCPPHLLKGILRHQEQNGPPRIGDVSMNSTKLLTKLAKYGYFLEV